MKIRNFLIAAVIPLLLSLGMVLIIMKISQVNKQIEEGIQRQYVSHKLANELRQSSDDLTRMVRTYTVTGDSSYKEYFQRILDIRNGVSPRPENYNGIFWDFVISGDNKLENLKTSEPISLKTLMIQAGFSEEELNKLEEAEAKSNMLAEQEKLAIAAMEGRYPDEQGGLSRLGKPDQKLAQSILHGLNYHRIKAEIM
jgi:methyl-accepting chemotaxis protein